MFSTQFLICSLNALRNFKYEKAVDDVLILGRGEHLLLSGPLSIQFISNGFKDYSEIGDMEANIS